MTDLPRVVVSSVVRSAHQGDSHGGIYLVDLASGEIEQKVDWNTSSISWEGRGADRGLRGIAFHEGLIYLAASDEIFVFDQGFQPQGSFRNPYLKHCHEIFIVGDALYVTSTGFDSVLEFDLRSHLPVRGYCLRAADRPKVMRRLPLRPKPTFSIFDPQEDGGPLPADTTHLNNVFHADGIIFVSGTGLANVWAIRGDTLERFARIPLGSHNARPFHDGVLMNHTASDRIAFLDRRGRVRRSFPIPSYPEDRLANAGLAGDVARQAFGRGLAVGEGDLIVGGSSPATVTAYRFDSPEIVKSVSITMDVRNAVHGLRVWPFA